jgi:hypothetical protein
LSVEGDAVITQELTQDLFVPLADIEVSRSTSSWSVAECGWKQILPDLPDDVIALLATPVVVTAEALVAPAPRPVETVVAATIEECTPRFLAPAPSRRVARQNRRARFA